MSGFSIIIPTYNRAELLRMALESVHRLYLPRGWEAEILVIDNNSSDHTAAVVREAKEGPLPVRRILETKQGVSNARNRGASEASFEHLVYLDDDELVDGDPPPLKWSDSEYGFWPEEDQEWEGRYTSPKRSSPSCAKLMF